MGAPVRARLDILPFNARVCINQHEWLARRLDDEGIRFRKAANAFVQCADPERLQQLADSFSPADLEVPVQHWLRELVPFYASADPNRVSDCVYRLFGSQVEYCTNLVFDRRAALDRMAERLLDLNRSIGRPDKLSTIFGYRVTKRYRGGLKTQIADHHLGNPVIRSEYKDSSIKQYVRDHRLLRTEVTSYNTPDLGVGKSIRNLPELRRVMRGINDRYLSIQQDVLETYVDRGQLARLHEPTITASGRRTPGIKLDDRRVLAVMQALTGFAHVARGGRFRTRDLHQPGDRQIRREVRHEFGDTRHRGVTYTLSAVTRFRQHFNPDEDAKSFVAQTVLAPTTVLSTKRPDAPVVIAVRPAFTWKESVQRDAVGVTLLRQRLASRLRIELARPWYTSGDGERLAVILWNRFGGLQPPPGVREFVTQVGCDPIWDTADPERWPTEPTLGGMVAPGATAKLAETELEVLAVPYEPWFHGDRWYADVALPGAAASSYSPFVHLAVARYQPDSIPGQELSAVVRTEMVGLLPDRTLTVRRAGGELFVALAGLGPAGPIANRVDVVLEECELPVGVAARQVDLTAFAPPGAGIAAWAPLPNGTRQAALGTVGGRLDLPDKPYPAARPCP